MIRKLIPGALALGLIASSSAQPQAPEAGKKTEAKAALQAALKLDPKFADAKTELGKL